MPQTRSKKRSESEAATPNPNRKKNRISSRNEDTPATPTDKSDEEEDAVESEREVKKRKPIKKETARKPTKKQKTLTATLSKRGITDSARSKERRRSKAASKQLPISTAKKRKAPEPASEASEDGILRAFDLDIKYGGCMGISRFDRWKRAKRFNLDPPEAVMKILSKHDKDDTINQCLWQGQV